MFDNTGVIEALLEQGSDWDEGSETDLGDAKVSGELVEAVVRFWDAVMCVVDGGATSDRFSCLHEGALLKDWAFSLAVLE